ncbi:MULTISPECIES: 3-oxoacid CoA-transferase subunit A [Achromobacter]|uniref:3-oxoacid CoA-transferase subunit A n=1 Tax=Achromobacter denitrificans TaxID=32002 RepID=A0A6N0JKE0_ACHDE|nr:MULTISPECIES: 3-oxoacid CoA-transferase subunit A [Achromobacter]MDF3861055.1 3-oxoacid CoA-transferase subunit A [Achromobacter denitrificans]MPT37506.1 3-oxoacid CoA-transferase subunit A [Achromobacter sp.]QKQ47585.1 3-oxoacid CoA-transferase subunit A [Achromobacter denitrificans]
MIDKQVSSVAEAVAGIKDDSVILVGGFGSSGRPADLMEGLLDLGVRGLTIVANNATVGDDVVSELMSAGRIRKVVCSFPRGLKGRTIFDELYAAGKIELDLVPQGTLAERIRAGAAGIGGFYTRTAAGTRLAEGKETRVIDGQTYVLEHPIKGDVALLKGLRGDRWGNLVYHRGARINNPVMAGAARLVIAQVREIVPLGALDPEHIVTPGVFVDRLVELRNERQA